MWHVLHILVVAVTPSLDGIVTSAFRSDTFQLQVTDIKGGGGSVCKYYIQEYFNHPEEREMVLCSIGGQCICGILGLTISNTNSPSSLCLDPISQYPCLWFLCRCLWYYFIFFFSSKKRLLSFMHSSEVFKIMKNWLEAKNIIFSLTAS